MNGGELWPGRAGRGLPEGLSEEDHEGHAAHRDRWGHGSISLGLPRVPRRVEAVWNEVGLQSQHGRQLQSLPGKGGLSWLFGRLLVVFGGRTL